MFCKKCGKQIDNDSIYCSFCGEVISNGIKVVDTKKEVNAIKTKDKKKSKIKFYLWQKIIMYITALITLISISYKDWQKPPENETLFSIGYVFDVVVGVALNLLILWALFKLINYVYIKLKEKQ